MAFHTATTQEQLIQQVQEYFEKRIFASDIVDVVIGLCCNVFSITLWIFQENEAGKLETISYNTNEEKNSRWHVHVALYRDRGDVDGLASHYNAVVSKNKNKGQIYIDLQSQEVSGSGPPSPFDVPTPVPSPSYGKDDFDPTYEHTELLPDFSSEPDASMYNLSIPQQRVLFPLELFEDMDNEQMTKVPYNINGNHCYTIEVHSGKWHKAQEDGRWFLMHTTTVRHSNLVRKSGKCMGSFVCNNDNCPSLPQGKAATHMSHFAYVCKTEGKNGISRLISKLLRTLNSSLRDHLFMLQNEVFRTT